MKLLLVDDESAIRMLLKLTFRDAPVQLHEASNGDEALVIASRENPDIVICDGTMPFSEGGEVGQRVRDLVPDALIVSFSGSDKDKAWADLSIMKGTAGDLERVRLAVQAALPPAD
jgi:two-component system, chemotaxis family, chemotaxis protein CheY